MHARWPDHAAALRERLALGDDELADWRDAVARIVTGLDPATGVYEQFAGFHLLEPLDLAAYADRTVPIDVVIGRELTQRSQVVKQADVVALIALLPEEFPGVMAETNFRHYEPRCAHGSSLSAGMHARVAARLGDAALALRYLRVTAATRPRPRPEQRRRRAHRRAGRSVAGGDARLRRSRPDGRRAGDRPEAPAPVAQPVIPGVLEGPVRGDPYCWQDRAGNAGEGRGDGDADRSCHAETNGGRDARCVGVADSAVYVGQNPGHAGRHQPLGKSQTQHFQGFRTADPSSMRKFARTFAPVP